MSYGLMSPDNLVDCSLFRVLMLVCAAVIFWVTFIKAPREYLERRKSGRGSGVDELVKRNWGDVSVAAASRRSSVIALLALPVTGIQCLLMGIFGAAYGFEDWLWYLLAMLVIFVTALSARELGWHNVMVPQELRGVPGLMVLRVRRFRDRRRGAGLPEE